MTDVGVKARRGDLVVWCTWTTISYLDRGPRELPRWHVGIVRSVTREGRVKSVETKFGTTPHRNPTRVHLVSKDVLDVEAAAHASWDDTNGWYERLEDVQVALKPFKLDK